MAIDVSERRARAKLPVARMLRIEANGARWQNGSRPVDVADFRSAKLMLDRHRDCGQYEAVAAEWNDLDFVGGVVDFDSP